MTIEPDTRCQYYAKKGKAADADFMILQEDPDLKIFQSPSIFKAGQDRRGFKLLQKGQVLKEGSFLLVVNTGKTKASFQMSAPEKDKQPEKVVIKAEPCFFSNCSIYIGEPISQSSDNDATKRPLSAGAIAGICIAVAILSIVIIPLIVIKCVRPQAASAKPSPSAGSASSEKAVDSMEIATADKVITKDAEASSKPADDEVKKEQPK